MNNKLRALVNPKQMKNMKAAGFKLIDVYDSMDYVHSTTKTAMFAKWELNASSDQMGRHIITLHINTVLPANLSYIIERVYFEGQDSTIAKKKPVH